MNIIKYVNSIYNIKKMRNIFNVSYNLVFMKVYMFIYVHFQVILINNI